MEEKAQGAIEYLLIIGAAVIIAVIVIALMMSLSQQGTGAAEDAGLDATFESAQCQKDCCYDTTLEADCAAYDVCTDDQVAACTTT